MASSIPHRLLANGATLAAQDDDRHDWIAIGLWARAGSRFDDNHRPGWAHLMEHLWFRGGARHSAADVDRLCDRLGGRINAETGRELIGLWGMAPADQWRQLATMLSDILVHPALAEQAIVTERELVRAELTLDPDPMTAGTDRLISAIWRDHPLGRPIGGSPDSLASADSGRLRAWHQQRLTGSRVAAISTGRYAASAASLLAEAMAELPASGSTPPPRTQPPKVHDPPPPSPPPDRPASLIWAIPLPGWRQPGYAEARLALTALAGGLDAVLPARLRRDKGLVYDLRADCETALDASIGFIKAEARSAAATVESVETELRTAAESGIPAVAQATAATQIQAQHAFAAADPISDLRRRGWELLAGTAPPQAQWVSETMSKVFDPDHLWRVQAEAPAD